MAIVLEVGGVVARYEDGEWTSESEYSAPVLAVLRDMMSEEPGPSGADPYRALTRVKDIASRLGGKITDEGQPPDFDSGVVY